MKFLCTVNWVAERLYNAETVYDLDEATVKKYAALRCRDGDLGAMSRFEPVDDAAKAAMAKLGKGDDEELQALRDEAKALKIQGAHLMGKEKLIDAIKKAKE